MYIPNIAKTLELTEFQIRLGLQGWPGTGKTYSALTFPNPIVADFDNKLGYHRGRKDVLVIPFNNPDFVSNILKHPPKYKGQAPNRRDAFIDWLRDEAIKLTEEQTLIIDSWTMLQAAIDQQISYEPVYTKKNEINEFAPWQAKLDYSAAICEILKGLNCSVVVTFHEMPVRDAKSGELLDKVKPLMQGQFTCQLAGHFTDWFRQVAIPKIDSKGKEVEIDAPSGNGGKYKLKNPTEYFWQIRGDDIFDASCGTMKQLQPNWKYIHADYFTFKEYL